MHSRIAETLEYLDTERAQLRAAIESVPAALRDQSPGPDRWSVAQVLEHLMIIEKRIRKLMLMKIGAAKADGLGPETDTSSVIGSVNTPKIVDRSFRVTAPEEIRPEGKLDAESALAALEQAREELKAAVLTGDGLALSEVMHDHPVLGSINLYQWILFVGSHEARHTGQVREIAEEFSAGSNTAASAT